MEHYFRTALCMILLIGYLQANPIYKRSLCEVELSDLRLDLLKETACGGENFTTPTNVEDKCMVTALKIFRNELQRVRDAKKCDDKVGYINGALQALEPISKLGSSPDCKWEDAQHLKPFGDFQKAFKNLTEQLESASAGCTQ